MEEVPGREDIAEGVAAPAGSKDQEVQEQVMVAQSPGPGGLWSADDPPGSSTSLDRPDDRTTDTDPLDTGRGPEDPASTTAATTLAQSGSAATDSLIAMVTQQVTAIVPAAPETTGESVCVPKTTTEDVLETPATSQQPEDEPRESQEMPHATVEGRAETTEEEPSEGTLAPLLENEQLAPQTEAEAPSSGAEMETAGREGGQHGSDSTPSESVEGREATTPAHHSEEEEEEEEEEEIIISASSADPQADAAESPPVETPSAPVPLGADGSTGQEADQTEVTTEASPLGAVAPQGPMCDCKLGVMGSIRAIRDLVSEMVDVEELVQRYPDGIPQEEE